MNIDYIIFDFDGVIVDSFDFHLRNYNSLPGVSVTAQELSDVHKGNFHDLTKVSITPETVEVYNSHLIDWFRASVGLVLSDTRKLLSTFSEIPMYVVTSGSEKTTNFLLKQEGLDGYFTQVLGSETSKSKVDKINILFEQGVQKNSSVFITDTLGDLIEAEKAGIAAVAVTFGFHDRETLKHGRYEAICDSWDEVSEWITQRRH